MTFYFYDLETSGFDPRQARIMQFAGRRTDMHLQPVGEPHNVLIKLTDDTLPDPDAIMVTGITPQQTMADGITEAEFLRLFHREIATPDTIFIGYNSVRFDDEFMRYLHYRNFYDAYEWQWTDGKSRWDLLDVVRMTRALRPEGIKWPSDSNGRPTNRLELLTSLNKLEHSNAHDALSDVDGTIAVARMIHAKQAKLWDYLLEMRGKQKVAALVESAQPFVYSSGKYPSEFEKTTVVTMVAAHPKKQGALVFDLRYDPADYVNLGAKALADIWKWKKDSDEPRLPVKTLQYNRCPAAAPMGVLDDASKKRLHIDTKTIERHFNTLRTRKDFAQNLLEACKYLDKEQQAAFLQNEQAVDGQLYDGFIDNADKNTMRAVRAANPEELASYSDKLHDKRLKALLPLYKARNFPASLTDKERTQWEAFRIQRLMGGTQNGRMQKYFMRLGELAQQTELTSNQRYLLEELQLYAESITPAYPED